MNDIRMTWLLPEQVAKFWFILRPAIEESMPPISVESPDRMVHVLEAILTSRLVVHVFDRVLDDGKVQVLAVIVTGKVDWFDSQHKDLLVYAIYNWVMDISQRDWMTGLVLLRKYKVGQGCKRILAYSNVDSIIKLFERFGSSDYRLLIME